MPTLADLRYYADTQVDTPFLARMVATEPSLEGISALAGGSTLDIATPRQRREAQAIRKQAQPVVNAVTDPVYAFTPGVDQRRQDARRRILEKVAAVTTDPMAATFAGVGAKMADKAALARSLEMKAAGVPDREIWAQTGWTHGFPDGKPRFEIDDSAAEFTGFAGGVSPEVKAAMEAAGLTTEGMGKSASSGAFPSTVSQMMQHERLKANYPEVSDIPVNWRYGAEQGGGHFTGESITVGYPDAAQGKSTLLHEAQHAIQDREGFAKGGVPEDYYRGFDEGEVQWIDNSERLDLITSELESISQWVPDKWNNGRYYTEMAGAKGERGLKKAELEQLKRALANEQSYILKEDNYLSPESKYHQLAGEVEARLTQRRMSLNAEQRRQRYPIDDMDVKPEDQIVRFGGGRAEMAKSPAKNLGTAQVSQMLVDKYTAPVQSAVDKSEHLKSIVSDGAAAKGECETAAQAVVDALHGQGYSDAKMVALQKRKVPVEDGPWSEWVKKTGKGSENYLWHAVVDTGDGIIDVAGSQYGSQYGGVRVMSYQDAAKEWGEYLSDPYRQASKTKFTGKPKRTK